MFESSRSKRIRSQTRFESVSPELTKWSHRVVGQALPLHQRILLLQAKQWRGRQLGYGEGPLALQQPSAVFRKDAVEHKMQSILREPNTKPRNHIGPMRTSHLTYSSEFYIPVQIIDQISKKMYLRWLLLADLPIQTKRGHFIINGYPKTVIHQIVRSPGIRFKNQDHQILADIISMRGAWMGIQIQYEKNLKTENFTASQQSYHQNSFQLTADLANRMGIYRRMPTPSREKRYGEQTDHSQLLTQPGVSGFDGALVAPISGQNKQGLHERGGGRIKIDSGRAPFISPAYDLTLTPERFRSPLNEIKASETMNQALSVDFFISPSRTDKGGGGRGRRPGKIQLSGFAFLNYLFDNPYFIYNNHVLSSQTASYLHTHIRSLSKPVSKRRFAYSLFPETKNSDRIQRDTRPFWAPTKLTPGPSSFRLNISPLPHKGLAVGSMVVGRAYEKGYSGPFNKEIPYPFFPTQPIWGYLVNIKGNTPSMGFTRQEFTQNNGLLNHLTEALYRSRIIPSWKKKVLPLPRKTPLFHLVPSGALPFYPHGLKGARPPNMVKMASPYLQMKDLCFYECLPKNPPLKLPLPSPKLPKVLHLLDGSIKKEFLYLNGSSQILGTSIHKAVAGDIQLSHHAAYYFSRHLIQAEESQNCRRFYDSSAVHPKKGFYVGAPTPPQRERFNQAQQ